MSVSSMFVALFTVTMLSGATVEIEGDEYPTYDQCIVQAEHDAKLMAPLRVEDGFDAPKMFKSVSVECLPVYESSGCVGDSCKLGGKHGR